MLELPPEEDDRNEYKSSKTAIKELRKKLANAASGFWNTGGGRFVAGVDDAGVFDGGIAINIGRQSLRDWADQAIHLVEPVGAYQIRVHDHGDGTGILEVLFEPSHIAPHMAPDSRYYVRAGAHTVPARSFIVEALWSKRGLSRPMIAHYLRVKPSDEDIIQLCILVIGTQPALDVSIELKPLPEMWSKLSNPFPLQVPIIDKETPFVMDLVPFAAANARIGDDVMLIAHYFDVGKKRYDYQTVVSIDSIGPWRLGGGNRRKTVRALQSLDQSLKQIAKTLGKS